MGAALDSAIADEIIGHSVDLLRLDAGTRAEILKILQRLQKDLIAELASNDLTTFNKARLQSLLAQTSTLVDHYYTMAQGEMQLTLTGVAQVQAQHIVDTIESVIGVNIGANLPTPTYLARLVGNALIQGAPSGDWWARQSLDTVFRFSNAVRQGLAASETNDQIIARIRGKPGLPGVMEVSRRNAEALVRTSVQTIAAEARRETFRKNADIINGIRQVSTLDNRTSDICIAYSGAEYDLNFEPVNGTALPYNGGVPRHWACRSVEVARTKSFAEMGINLPEPAPGMRAAMGETVPEGTTFAEWLSRRTVAQQDEQLGPGRAQLWRDGKITLNQLLSMDGNPLTLAQLKAKYAKP